MGNSDACCRPMRVVKKTSSELYLTEQLHQKIGSAAGRDWTRSRLRLPCYLSAAHPWTYLVPTYLNKYRGT